MEQPFSAGDMLVPNNPAPFLLSPDTGGPKRFVVFPTKWNSPPVPVKKAAKDSSQQHPRLLLNLTARRVIQWLVAGWASYDLLNLTTMTQRSRMCCSRKYLYSCLGMVFGLNPLLHVRWVYFKLLWFEQTLSPNINWFFLKKILAYFVYLKFERKYRISMYVNAINHFTGSVVWQKDS